MFEAILNSTVLAAIVTTGGAISLTVVTYWISTKKKRKTVKGKHSEDPSTYAGYEALLNQYREEVTRLYAVATDREELIAILRLKESELYKEIEQKNQEIDFLRHRREYLEEAEKIKRENKDERHSI